MKTKISAMGLAYAVNKDRVTCRITGIGVYEKELLLIPDSLDGYPVTSIAKEAFLDRAELISAEIADGVTVIGAEAFRDCPSLTGAILPSGLQAVGYGIFACSESLRAVTLREAMQDLRVLRLAEAKLGRDAVLAVLENSWDGGVMTMTAYPTDPDWFARVRETLATAMA